MVCELESGTDVASHAIYDPGALAHLTPEELVETLYESLYQIEPAKGNLIHYDVASDGSTLFRLYVDEPIPAEFVERAEVKTENLLLRVPSGTLVASGVEYVNVKKEIERASAFAPGVGALITKTEIPPGNYLATAYEFSWDWDKEIAPILKREMGTWYSRENAFGPMAGLGCVSAAISIPWLIIELAVSGWSWNIFWWVCASICWVATSVLLFKALIPKEYWVRKNKIEARFPPNMLVLTRLPDGTDISQYHGGGFGFAAQERQPAIKK